MSNSYLTLVKLENESLWSLLQIYTKKPLSTTKKLRKRNSTASLDHCSRTCTCLWSSLYFLGAPVMAVPLVSISPCLLQTTVLWLHAALLFKKRIFAHLNWKPQIIFSDQMLSVVCHYIPISAVVISFSILSSSSAEPLESTNCNQTSHKALYFCEGN